MKLIIGLGNPGLEYKNTRHNIGFLAVDNFAKANSIKIEKKGFGSLFAEAALNGEEIVLLKPQTFMNNSGEAVSAAVERWGIRAGNILVVCDDVNLILGIIRFRDGGSAGGHNGLKSIIDKSGTKDFNRLRIGIDAQRSGILKDYVLSTFRSSEKKLAKETVERATDAICIWIAEGIGTAMNKYNEKNPA